MNGAEVVMGLLMICGSLLGYRHESLILGETGYGRLIRRCFGEDRARPAYRVLLLLLAALGFSFAAHLIPPPRRY